MGTPSTTSGAGDVDSRARQIIAASGSRPLLEVVRNLQREEGCLKESSLTLLAESRLISLTRLYGIVTSHSGFELEGERQAERPIGVAIEAPSFLADAANAAYDAGCKTSGPMCGRFDDVSDSIESYRAAGGLAALEKARHMPAEQLISEIVLGGITADPTGWQMVEAAAADSILVASAHSGDPTSRQGELLLERDSYQVLEGMSIGALATGAKRGFLFTAPGNFNTAENLIRAAEEFNDAAKDDFLVEVVAGPETLVGSEKSVVVGSLERDRPMPFPRDPARRGIWRRPTLVDAVETFAAITATLAGGKPAGARLYQVSGAVERPGIYEVEPATSLNDLAASAGVTACSAVLVGGLSGVFASGEEMQKSLSAFERHDNPRWRAVHVLGSNTDIWEAARQMAAYNGRYLCGYCIPCRIGAVRMSEIMEEGEDLETLAVLARAVESSGLCHAGKGAAAMVASALRVRDVP